MHSTSSARPRTAPFLGVFTLVVMAAVGLATAPILLGADTSYLTVATLVVQWVPFATVAVLHAVYRLRHREDAAATGWTLSFASATRLRGNGGRILRTALLAAIALVAVCFVPMQIAGLFGFVDLRWTADATSAALLVVPVTLLFMIPVAGEELAWRGYLTTLLSPRGFATTTAVIAGVWAAWHLPLTIALAAAGELAPRDVVAKTVDLLLAAVLVSAMRYLSGSVWPAVFAHSLFNNLFQMAQSTVMSPLAEASAGAYWGYQTVSWVGWLAVDALLVALVYRRTRGVLPTFGTRERAS